MSSTQSKLKYFDYAAATPLSNTALDAMEPYFKDKFYNPSALYLAAQDVKSALNLAKDNIAGVLKCKPSEIIFTAGGTEANNLAIRGIMTRFKNANCVVNSIEHDSVLVCAREYKHKLAPVNNEGVVDLKKLDSQIDDNTVLVSVMYVNNEVGAIQPIKEVSKIIAKHRQKRVNDNNRLPLYLHTDACQAANYLPLLVNSLGVDLMTVNGGKIYGPKQSGFLYVKTGVVLASQIVGGGQERNLRSGTENVAANIGLASALAEAHKIRDVEAKRLTNLRDNFISKLQNNNKILLNGPKSKRLANNIHLTLMGLDNERILMELDEKGYMVATGSACSASSDEPSHVLKAMGLSDEIARSSIRITLGRQTNNTDLTSLAKEILVLVATDIHKG